MTNLNFKKMSLYFKNYICGLKYWWLLLSVISDTYEQFDALTACFPWCTTTTARCIPRGSRSISLEPHVKSLHLTLAYQFPNAQYSQLKALVDALDPSLSSGWELRLYSRDPRVNGKQVHKVIHPYAPTECDELELRAGDYVYLSTEALASSLDGWVEGTSWLTGCTGFLPVSYTERTAESDAWTLHRKVSLNNPSESTSSSRSASQKETQKQHPPLRQSFSDSYSFKCKNEPQIPRPEINSFTPSNIEDEDSLEKEDSENMEADVSGSTSVVQSNREMEIADILEGKTSLTENEAEISSINSSLEQKLFIMRHGERVDFTFGTWIPYCFDENGKYVRKDLNMPSSLPDRKAGPLGYKKDSPLTQIGIYQAYLVGEALRDCESNIERVYCSPSFRCLQTCDAVLKGLGKKDTIKIRIEPGLFEWLVWYPEGLPDWISPDDLVNFGFNIDLNYTPFISKEKLADTRETCEQFYMRSSYITKGALALHPTENILFVGHAATLDVCSRELVGGKPRSSNEMSKLLPKVPYCSMTVVAQNGGTWDYCEPPFPPIMHSNNQRFDWKIWLQ